MAYLKLHSREKESHLCEAGGDEGEERVNIKVGTHHNSPAENHILQFQLGDKVPASPGDIRIETQVRVYPPAAIEIPKEGVLIA